MSEPMNDDVFVEWNRSELARLDAEANERTLDDALTCDEFDTTEEM